MKPTKSDILKWTQALRSGEYKQTKKNLQNEIGFCCVGVACDVFIPKEDQKRNDIGHLHGSIAEAQPKAPDWLIELVEFNSLGVSPYTLNDNGVQIESIEPDYGVQNKSLEPFTFDEIADLLEAVYIHEVLS